MTTTISGDTGIDKVQDGTIVQSDLAANVAGTGPCFSAYPTVNQNLTSGAWSKIALQAKEFDTSNSFDSTSGYRFQPNVAGYYKINGTLSADLISLAAIYKNGVEAKRGSQMSESAIALSVDVLLYLNGTTDYVELWGYAAVATVVLGRAVNTYFQGFLARAA